RRAASRQRRASSGRATNEAMSGAATNTADECACTARRAAAVAAASYATDDWRPPRSTSASDVFTKATASGGFQIVALKAMSNGAVAMNSTTASAIGNEAVNVQSAANSAT